MRYHTNNPPDFKPAYATREAWLRRSDALRRRTAIALGLATMPDRPPVSATIHGRMERDGYTVEKVYFPAMPGVYVTGNLYRPANARAKSCPVVLHPYGHWPEGRFNWQSDEKIDDALAKGAERLRSSARSPLQACNVTFARMGCVVFHYDMLGYCDSKQVVHAQGFDDAEAVMRSQGQMGLQTFNSIRALDFVSALPEVDAERIAVGGASSGGTQTLMLGIMDDRPRALFIAGMIGMNMQGGCPCENAPLLRLDSNNVELCATLAPRHVFCSGAKGDWTHDADVRGLPELKQIYGFFGAADRIDGNVLNWPHNFNAHTRADFYALVDRALKLNAGGATIEREFEPIPPAELRVFDETHPRPTDEMDIPTVRERWRPRVDVKELLGAWIGAVEPNSIGFEVVAATTIQLRNVARASGTCSIQSRAGGPCHEMALVGIEPIHLLKDKPAWFDYVFNRPAVIDRARQIIAIALSIKSKTDAPLQLIADASSSVVAAVVCAARPGLFDVATLDLKRFEFDQIAAVEDERLFPGALACGGIKALLEAAHPTRIELKG